MKAHQMRTSEQHLFRAWYSKCVSHHRQRLVETQRQVERQGFREGKRSLGVPWLEAASPESDILCKYLGVCIWLSLVGSKLEVGTQLRNQSVINQVLEILN